jgi:citrate synthase
MEIKPGLEGVVFTETHLSAIDGTIGKLSYCGYDIYDLAEKATYEEIAFLLWYQRMPADSELTMLSNWLRENRILPKPVWGIMHVLPDQATPMEALRTVASTLSMFDKSCAHEEVGGSSLCRSVSLTAKLPTIVASFDRLRRNKPPIEPNNKLGHGANFVYMLTGEFPDEVKARAIEVYLILLADHGMNASTFSARVTSSTLGDIYSATVTALGTLKGPLHGGANEAAMKQFVEIGSVENVDAWFTNKMAEKGRIMGMGHRVYKTEDPRSIILRKMAKDVAKTSKHSQWYDIAAKLEEKALNHSFFKERQIYPNVDYYSGPLLYALGIPVDLFTTLFAMSRIAGWTAHMLEQQHNNRLIRPRAKYVGPENVEFVDMSQREPMVEAQPDIQCVAGRPANCPVALRIDPEEYLGTAA